METVSVGRSKNGPIFYLRIENMYMAPPAANQSSLCLWSRIGYVIYTQTSALHYDKQLINQTCDKIRGRMIENRREVGLN